MKWFETRMEGLRCPKCGSSNVWSDLVHEGCNDCGWFVTYG